MIDIESERLLSPSQACRHPAFAGPDGRPCHVASVYRLIQRGKPDGRGRRVHLETIKTPRGTRTSAEAVGRFLDALNADGGQAPRDADATTPAAPVARRTSTANTRDRRELAAAGWSD